MVQIALVAGAYTRYQRSFSIDSDLIIGTENFRGGCLVSLKANKDMVKTLGLDTLPEQPPQMQSQGYGEYCTVWVNNTAQDINKEIAQKTRELSGANELEALKSKVEELIAAQKREKQGPSAAITFDYAPGGQSAGPVTVMTGNIHSVTLAFRNVGDASGIRSENFGTKIELNEPVDFDFNDGRSFPIRSLIVKETPEEVGKRINETLRATFNAMKAPETDGPSEVTLERKPVAGRQTTTLELK